MTSALIVAAGGLLAAGIVRAGLEDVTLELCRIRHELEASRRARGELTVAEQALAALPYGEADR